MRQLYIACRCHTPYHLIRISEDEDVSDHLYIEFVSTGNGSFWHRIKHAMKHVFRGADLVFADVIIRNDELREALAELQK